MTASPDLTEGGDVGDAAGNEPLLSPELLAQLGLNIGSDTDSQRQESSDSNDSSNTESNSQATEPDEELREAARKAGEEDGYLRAKRELDEQQAAAQEELKRSGEYQDFQKRYRDRIASFESDDLATRFLQANTGTEVKAVLADIKEQFNSHHADGLKLYKDEAIASVAADYTDQIFDSVGSALGEDTKKAITEAHEARKPSERSWKAFVTDLVDAARKDTYTSAKANEVAQAAVAKVAKDEKWLRARLSQLSAPGSSGTHSSTPSDDESILARYSRGEAVDKKLVQQALARLSDAKIVA